MNARPWRSSPIRRAVADVGCGAGRITAHLRSLGLDPFGIDLSPAMVEVARRDHPADECVIAQPFTLR
ncbi:trans-aconitate 2-methyltransferase [Streptacidiphilus sp. MAP12-20]|uniref:class I SAM-dependent methyltransferase n=1 Tax=Streptacidiphilus sp. MAP12-20 TaxID=3156299 RepID=UPI00351870DB